MKYYKNLIYWIYYRIEYKIFAYLSFIFAKLKGSNYRSRTIMRGDISFLKERLSKNRKKRLAIFVAFHSRDLIPKSNLNHLKVLKKSFFEIVYVHNGILSKEVKNQLTQKGCYVICRENIGQDFGAWKDLFELISYYKLTKDLNWLLFCNDSNFCLGGINSDKFISKLTNNLEKENEFDFISLNCNYEKSLHHQSYFLCFSKNVFQNQKFQEFWKKYLPLSDRFHAIENGEKKFSKEVLNYFRPNVIYTSYELFENISLNLNNKDKTLLGNLPKTLFYLEELMDSDKTNHTKARLELMRIISSLESYNQSHVFALLNIVFLDSPFLKKDLIRQGIFSFCQVYDVLKLNDLKINQDLQEEIINFLQRAGTSYSYIEDKRIAHRQGISVNGIPYNYQQDSQLLKEKAS